MVRRREVTLDRGSVSVMKLRIVGAVAGTALALAACGGGSSKSVAPSPVSSPPVVSATPTSTPTPTIPVGPKGIIARTSAPYSSSIITYDSVTHQQQSISISDGGGYGSSENCGAPDRQRYSPNFDKEVWCSKGNDETTSIGYVDIPSGTVHNLTPVRGSNWSSQSPHQRLPIFNPKTGDLWFYDDKLESFMSFDLSNPGQAPQKRSAPVLSPAGLVTTINDIVVADPSSDDPLGSRTLSFSVDGSIFAATATGSSISMAPDRKTAIIVANNVPITYNPEYSSLALQKEDGTPPVVGESLPAWEARNNTLLKWASGTELLNCDIKGIVVIDASSFLCTGYPKSSTQASGSHAAEGLYMVTTKGSTMTPLQLTPDSENGIDSSQSFLVSPDKQSVAFVAGIPGVPDPQLLTVSLKGGEPTQIGSFTGTKLIDWK